eukprot:2272926-Amphidinium_carterae.1
MLHAHQRRALHALCSLDYSTTTCFSVAACSLACKQTHWTMASNLHGGHFELRRVSELKCIYSTFSSRAAQIRKLTLVHQTHPD